MIKAINDKEWRKRKKRLKELGWEYVMLEYPSYVNGDRNEYVEDLKMLSDEEFEERIIVDDDD